MSDPVLFSDNLACQNLIFFDIIHFYLKYGVLMIINRQFGALNILPDEILDTCFDHLSPKDLGVVASVNKSCRALAYDSSRWARLCQSDFHLNPPDPTSARRIYQIHSNMKQGKFLVQDKSWDYTTAIGLIEKKFTPQKRIVIQDPQSYDLRLLTLLFPLPLTGNDTGIWNGTHLATMHSRTGKSILIWREAEGNFVCRQKLQPFPQDHTSLEYQWHGKELLTLSNKGTLEGRKAIFQIWKPGLDQNLVLDFTATLTLPGQVEEFLNDQGGDDQMFAWDGAYLAIRIGSSGIDIWKKVKENEKEKLEKSHSLDWEDVTSLKWNGKFLFAGDDHGDVKIYNRELPLAIHTIHCPVPQPEKDDDDEPYHNHDFVFRGNLVFIFSNWCECCTLTLWQQSEDGGCKKLQGIIEIEHDTETIPQGADIVELVMHDNSLFFQVDNSVVEFKFGES
jgi:WD40 repeat protein